MEHIDNIHKPCPFCGSNEYPVLSNVRRFNGSNGSYEEVDYFLQCDGCNMQIGNGDAPNYDGDVNCDFSTEAEALAFWNKRNPELDMLVMTTQWSNREYELMEKIKELEDKLFKANIK